MKSTINVSLVSMFLVFALFMGVNAFAANQTTCPVMGGKITNRLFSDYKGVRVFFCCFGCKPAFEKEPEKYLAKLKEMGQEPFSLGK